MEPVAEAAGMRRGARAKERARETAASGGVVPVAEAAGMKRRGGVKERAVQTAAGAGRAGTDPEPGLVPFRSPRRDPRGESL
jgi:hypothetical protein